MQSYQIELEEEGQKRTLEVTAAGNAKNGVRSYNISEKGKDLGQLVIDGSKHRYEGDEDFSPDDLNLIALSITSSKRETVIDSEEDDLDDDEEI